MSARSVDRWRFMWISNHVNEDDEKLNTSIMKEEDQRSVLIIRGIQIFLLDSPVEARACVADATT
jgi:hypothetical protein